MDVRNLSEPHAKKLEDYTRKLSSEIETETYDLERDGKSTRQQIDEINEKLDRIENFLKNVFGDHILINGKFKEIRVKE